MQATQREELHAYLDALLESPRFRDYCPNGLQVEGRERIARLVCGVTASQALIDAAVACNADGILVHHGLFWKGDDGRITGFRKRRLAALLTHDINLFAYHLPLDAHPELGNNAQLAARLGWRIEGRFGEQDVGFCGALPAPSLLGDLATGISTALGRPALLLGDAARPVTRIAWCSGGAQGYFEAALGSGAEVFVSGEVSEQTTHLARETGMAFIAAGHHATERYGVQALGVQVARQFGIAVDFVDIDNPV